MGNLNKSYLGYKAKDDNVIKLAQYLRVKGVLTAPKNALNDKFTKLSSNKIMKNKRWSSISILRTSGFRLQTNKI